MNQVTIMWSGPPWRHLHWFYQARLRRRRSSSSAQSSDWFYDDPTRWRQNRTSCRQPFAIDWVIRELNDRMMWCVYLNFDPIRRLDWHSDFRFLWIGWTCLCVFAGIPWRRKAATVIGTAFWTLLLLNVYHLDSKVKSQCRQSVGLFDLLVKQLLAVLSAKKPDHLSSLAHYHCSPKADDDDNRGDYHWSMPVYLTDVRRSQLYSGFTTLLFREMSSDTHSASS